MLTDPATIGLSPPNARWTRSMDARPSLNAGSKAEVGPWPAVMAGLLAAAVGYGSSFAIVLQGLIGAGASPGQAASGLLVVCVVQGLVSIGFVLRLRMPISIAWSTPGAVLLAATGVVPGGFHAAVGAFLVVGVLIIAAGLWRPLGPAVLPIPRPIASPMLARLPFRFFLPPLQPRPALGRHRHRAAGDGDAGRAHDHPGGSHRRVVRRARRASRPEAALDRRAGRRRCLSRAGAALDLSHGLHQRGAAAADPGGGRP